VIDGVDLAWQPQRQLSPGQLTHWHGKVAIVLMKFSGEVEGFGPGGSVESILVGSSAPGLNETANLMDCVGKDGQRAKRMPNTKANEVG
jgi:hypothetical protein